MESAAVPRQDEFVTLESGRYILDSVQWVYGHLGVVRAIALVGQGETGSASIGGGNGFVESGTRSLGFCLVGGFVSRGDHLGAR